MDWTPTQKTIFATLVMQHKAHIKSFGNGESVAAKFIKILTILREHEHFVGVTLPTGYQALQTKFHTIANAIYTAYGKEESNLSRFGDETELPEYVKLYLNLKEEMEKHGSENAAKKEKEKRREETMLAHESSLLTSSASPSEKPSDSVAVEVPENGSSSKKRKAPPSASSMTYPATNNPTSTS